MPQTKVDHNRYLAPDRAVTVYDSAGKPIKVNLRAIEDITEATLKNGWSNSGGAAPNASYYKNLFGEVRLRGLISGGTTADTTVILVLPSGYRPDRELSMLCSQGTGSTWTAKIASNGEISCYGLAASTAVSLDNINFRSA